jgi:16S rRNA (cytosine967-C5)-methyltransferase
MPLSPARQAAYEILRRVESGRDFAVDLLEGAGLAALKDADRRLATEIVMGTLRWRGELDNGMERLSSKPLKYFDPEIATILRMSVYQIRFLEKIPKSAAVNEAVELVKLARKRSAAGLVNAVLRKCPRAEKSSPAPSAGNFSGAAQARVEGACRSLPAWLRERWEKNFSADGMRALAWAAVQVPPATLRVSSAKDRDAVREELTAQGLEVCPGRFSPLALAVEKGTVRGLKALREGRIFLQDEASQLVASLLAPRAGERVLDLCAAPGIKTAQLAVEQGRGMLVSCDLSARRLRTMGKLLPKNLPGRLRLVQVRLDASHELPFGCSFDRILVDAPCSGTGTLARNPEIKLRLAPEDLARLAEMQERILSNALGALAPRGRLVYATCSLEPEENEGVVEKALAARRDFRLLSQAELASESPQLASLFDEQGYFRTRPDLHGMDGFFAAVITRIV